MKNKKYHTVGTIPKSNIIIVGRVKSDTPNIQINNRSLSWLDTGTSIKSGGAKLVLLTQTYPEMKRSCKCSTKNKLSRVLSSLCYFSITVVGCVSILFPF
jgi:hypothetical protein